ncbi:MAG: hypothetical protein PVF58_02610 [Candidatus Methanofastidiosia archaeon]|jgi:hypothetical protein
MARLELKKMVVILLVGCFSCCVTQQYEQEKVGGVEAEMVVLDSVEYNNGTVDICMRNTGSGPVVIDTEYKNGVIVATEIGRILEVSETTCFTLQGTDYSDGDKCRLVTEEGTIIVFEVRE